MSSYSLSRAFGVGCGDNSCMFGPRGGMGTNGGCRCFERTDGNRTREEIERRAAVGRGLRLLRHVGELPDVAMALDELVRRAQGVKP
jgi:hypothetical protein